MRNVVYLTAIVTTIAVACHVAFGLSGAGSPRSYFVLAVPTIILAVVGLVRATLDGVVKSWLSVRSGDFSRGFAAAALLFFAAYAFTRIVAPPESANASWLARLYLQMGDPAQLRKNLGTVVVGLAVMAAAEEIVWRGLVVSLLEEMIGSRRAWVWAAVLYAVAHAPTAWALSDPVAGPNPVIVLGALACGLVWGGMARWFGRLLPGFFSHLLFTWTVVMMFRLWGPSV